ncbi:alpha-ketoglutarate-dependent dioxygenase AlkB [Armatimonas sp.]|uniref:alpha-ketoglutarate-dependent dioxygenase AlkB family protein n=1 Tax=Armatimonas sp. TaxID=1872638 RepID=UPI00286C5392|nr:alpha-ketoglutarate-dependent dioxygenase AlkB [Armatimonas sp.]
MDDDALGREGSVLDMPDADVRFYPDFFNEPEATRLLAELTQTIPWRQDQIRLFGRWVDQPRLTAWHGDPGCSYTYSGMTMQPQAWTAELLAIKERIEPVAGVVFNSVLLNYYRTERDSMGWHSDDEKELGENPVIASVNLGATRRFHFKHKSHKEQRVALDLTAGSLLIMAGTTQHFWLHQLPKSARSLEPRINLTFRVIR